MSFLSRKRKLIFGSNRKVIFTLETLLVLIWRSSLWKVSRKSFYLSMWGNLQWAQTEPRSGRAVASVAFVWVLLSSFPYHVEELCISVSEFIDENIQACTFHQESACTWTISTISPQTISTITEYFLGTPSAGFPLWIPADFCVVSYSVMRLFPNWFFSSVLFQVGKKWHCKCVYVHMQRVLFTLTENRLPATRPLRRCHTRSGLSNTKG